ncbi:energy transducer TonB [Sphingomonas sp. RB3P16]|uniref:energy transducer TonB n=1 Tax=Parasphingomonas frigoris TaxID=3096163 RepID=UPI002FCA1AB9
MKSIAIAALLVTAQPVPTQTAPLAPTGKWTVDYADAACILSRDYGTADARTTLGVNPSPLGSGLELITVTPGATTTRYRPTKGTLTLQPSGRTIDSEISRYQIKARNQTVTTLRAEGDAATEILRSSSLSITSANGSQTAFAMPGMKSAAGALRACQDDLLRQWKIDPAERDLPPLSTGATSPAQWITNDDYPTNSLDASEQGATTIAWTIKTDGKVADCRVVNSSGSKALDEASCSAITRRGRYAPPLGTDGKPQVRHGIRKIVWLLPS